MKDLENYLKERLSQYLWQREENGRKSAAVVLPLRKGQEDWELLFVVKAEGVGPHSGQVSFPGGVVEEESEEEAALRELKEEVGLENVQILGRLSDQPTYVTSYVIAPFVGLVSPPFHLSLDSREIQNAFWAPLGLFYSPRHQGVKQWVFEGVVRYSPCYFYQSYEIWGATARILGEFLALVAPLYQGESV